MPFNYVISAFLCIFLSSNSLAQNRTQKIFEGTINTTILVQLSLTQSGSAVFGNVVYKKKGIPITVAGTFSDNTYFLHELMPDGTVTGLYSAEAKGNSVTGIWSSPRPNAKELKLSLTQTGTSEIPIKPLGTLTGTYNYSFGKDGGTGQLQIVQNNPGSIIIAFDCVNGPPAYNMALINKTTLKLNGNQALYETKEYGNCKIRLVFDANIVQVDYLGEAYDCGFGNAASVVGNYIKTNSSKPVFESR
jgi:hypothetical protein